MYQYYLKVVPTGYFYLDGRIENSHQFSVTFHQKELKQGRWIWHFSKFYARNSGVSGLPGFFVQYEFSPLMVHYEERQK